MQKHIPILIFGLLTAITFAAAVTIGYSLLPEKFSLLSNWVSDLGNPAINPEGAKYFNYGCLLTAFFFFQFDLVLCDIKTRSKKRKVLLAISEVFGVFSASAMVGLALFHAGQPTITHYLFASTVLFFASTFFLGTVYALKRFRILKNLALLYILFGIFLACIIALVAFRQLLGEWIAVGFVIAYILYFSIALFVYLLNKKTL